MPAYKDDKNGTWYARFKFTDWTGQKKDIWKRGFKTKHEATQWEAEYKSQKNHDLDMPFGSFLDIYIENIGKRLKESTMCTKTNIIEKHIRPYFSVRKLSQINASDVIQWQNEMMKIIDPRTKQAYTKSYLKTLHNQLSAIFNYAVKFYGLSSNPAKIVGNMGTDKETKMSFWTLEQYKKFSETMMEKPFFYYCFEVLYWCGIREGELLALNVSDIDFERKSLSISKTFHHINGKDIVTTPKTFCSNRTITIPDFLCDELKEYLSLTYDAAPGNRLFPTGKSQLYRAMNYGIQKANLPYIRVHDLRHSHVSLLINEGYNAVAIAERLGHESIDITLHYAHLFPNMQANMANTLDGLKGDD